MMLGDGLVRNIEVLETRPSWGVVLSSCCFGGADVQDCKNILISYANNMNIICDIKYQNYCIN